MIPRRRKQPKMGTREEVRECPTHIAWVRGHECLVRDPGYIDGPCSNRIEGAHVRHETDGGTGLKPSDRWVVPLCSKHHAEQHQIGEPAFELKYNINLKDCARELWNRSPARIKYDRKLAATMARTKQIERM